MQMGTRRQEGREEKYALSAGDRVREKKKNKKKTRCTYEGEQEREWHEEGMLLSGSVRACVCVWPQLC